VESPHVA